MKDAQLPERSELADGADCAHSHDILNVIGRQVAQHLAHLVELVELVGAGHEGLIRGDRDLKALADEDIVLRVILSMLLRGIVLRRPCCVVATELRETFTCGAHVEAYPTESP
jgi:hypothetical protein